MDPDLLLPATLAGITLGISSSLWLIGWRRRLPANFAGQVKRDISLAMLRSLILLLAGLVLWLGMAAGWLPDAGPLRWLALALMGSGGVALAARAALYRLRIKPNLDRLSVPVAPSSPAVETREGGPGEG